LELIWSLEFGASPSARCLVLIFVLVLDSPTGCPHLLKTPSLICYLVTLQNRPAGENLSRKEEAAGQRLHESLIDILLHRPGLPTVQSARAAIQDTKGVIPRRQPYGLPGLNRQNMRSARSIGCEYGICLKPLRHIGLGPLRQ
jgi:hypothetical protein